MWEGKYFDLAENYRAKTSTSTTTDICALLKTGYPRQSAAFVKIAGVRTNYTIPDVHNIALGGGSLVRDQKTRISIGPDSIGSRLEQDSIAFGGETLTVSEPCHEFHWSSDPTLLHKTQRSENTH